MIRSNSETCARRALSAGRLAVASGGARAWFSWFSGVTYSAARYTKSSLVFQLNTDLRSASIENARYACAGGLRGAREAREGWTAARLVVAAFERVQPLHLHQPRIKHRRRLVPQVCRGASVSASGNFSRLPLRRRACHRSQRSEHCERRAREREQRIRTERSRVHAPEGVP